MGWVAKTTPRPLYLRERDRVLVLQEGGWTPRPVWKYKSMTYEEVTGCYLPLFGCGDLKFPVDVDTADKVIYCCLRSRRLVIAKAFKFLWFLVGYFLLVDDNKNSNRPFTQHNSYCTKYESLHVLHAANITGPFHRAVVLVRTACLSAGHTEESDVVRCSAGKLQTVVLRKKRQHNVLWLT